MIYNIADCNTVACQCEMLSKFVCWVSIFYKCYGDCDGLTKQNLLPPGLMCTQECISVTINTDSPLPVWMLLLLLSTKRI